MNQVLTVRGHSVPDHKPTSTNICTSPTTSDRTSDSIRPRPSCPLPSTSHPIDDKAHYLALQLCSQIRPPTSDHSSASVLARTFPRSHAYAPTVAHGRTRTRSLLFIAPMDAPTSGHSSASVLRPRPPFTRPFSLFVLSLYLFLIWVIPLFIYFSVNSVLGFI